MSTVGRGHLSIVATSGIALSKDVLAEFFVGREGNIIELYGGSRCIHTDVDGIAPRILSTAFSWIIIPFSYAS